MKEHDRNRRIKAFLKMSTAVAATHLACFVSLACSSSSLKSGAGDAATVSWDEAGSATSNGTTGGDGGAIGAVGTGGISIGETTGSGGVKGRNRRCGNGVLEAPEQCDDGNTVSGDGCSSLCQIETNYICPSPGKPCLDIAVCGDGVLTPDEACDPPDAGEGSPGDAGCPLGSFDCDGTPVCNCPSGTMVLCTTACQYPFFLP